VWINSTSLLLEWRERAIDGVAFVRVPVGFPGEVRNDPIGYIRLSSFATAGGNLSQVL
jgi:hypothetical protein